MMIDNNQLTNCLFAICLMSPMNHDSEILQKNQTNMTTLSFKTITNDVIFSCLKLFYKMILIVNLFNVKH